MRHHFTGLTRAVACLALLGGGVPALPASATAAQAGATGGAASVVETDNGQYSFRYAIPAAAVAIPGLNARLQADRAAQLANLKRNVAAGVAEAKADQRDFIAYDFSRDWSVVTSLPGWLSLSAASYEFSGGAHGNTMFTAMVWNRTASGGKGAVVPVLDLFQSKTALAAVLRGAFCAQLDRQRAEKRGEPVNRASGDPFDECIDPTAQTIILGSRSKRAFDRIGILVGPYAAGPYVEGTYEVTLPVTPAVLAVVRPEYRASFAVTR